MNDHLNDSSPMLSANPVDEKGDTHVNAMIKRIGCGAYMTSLRRISSDKFNVANAITIEQLSNMNPSAIKKILIPVASAVPSFAL